LRIEMGNAIVIREEERSKEGRWIEKKICNWDCTERRRMKKRWWNEKWNEKGNEEIQLFWEKE
jgi:hypothetical protein